MPRPRTKPWTSFFNAYFCLSLFLLLLYAASCGKGMVGPSRNNSAIDPADLDDIAGSMQACPAGGQLKFGSVSLLIPSGALNACVNIGLSVDDAVEVGPNTNYANIESYAPHPLVFAPHGLKFNSPIVVRITTSRQLIPGTLVPILYKDAEETPWQGLYLTGDGAPSFGVVLEDGFTIAYATDHFSRYVQFNPGLTTELLGLCGPFSTINGSVPFTCPQYLYGNGWPPELSLKDAGTRSRAYRNAIRDVILAPDIHQPDRVGQSTEDVVTSLFNFLDVASFSAQTASDKLFDLAQRAFPKLTEFEGTNGHGFVPIRTRFQGTFNGILGRVDQVGIAYAIRTQIGKTAFAIWVINTVDYAAAASRMVTLKNVLMQSPLWKDPALQAAWADVLLDVQQDYDARDAGIISLLGRAVENRIDSWDWVSNYPDLMKITTPVISKLLKLPKAAGFITFAAGMIIDWAAKLDEATKGAQYLAALGTLFVYGGLNNEYGKQGLSVALPTAPLPPADVERWNRNLMAETVLYRMAEQSKKAVTLGDVHWTQWGLQRLGELLSRVAGVQLDRGAIAARLDQQAVQHGTNADAIRDAMLLAQRIPPAPLPVVSVSPTSGRRGTVFDVAGSSCTANASVSLYRRRPDGVELAVVTQSVDVAGGFHSYFTPDATAMLGTWSLWVVDNSSGRRSNLVSFTITGTTSSPSVSVSPSSGPRGTTFYQPGTSFTPGGSVTLHFRRPDGTEAPTASHVVDGSGAYSHSWTTDSGTPLGTWTYWAVDNTTGVSSSAVNLTVTGVMLSPVVSVSPARAPRGATFQEPGSGFTPGSTVTLHFRRPDGTEAGTASHVTDGSGSYSHSWTTDSGTLLGTWTYWAVDNTTGTVSNLAYLTLTQPAVSVTPGSGRRGTVFSEPGSGFTPGSTVTLHFRRPDGTEAGTASHVADGSGAYSHSWTTDSGTLLGTWTYWAVDDATGTASTPVYLTLSP